MPVKSARPRSARATNRRRSPASSTDPFCDRPRVQPPLSTPLDEMRAIREDHIRCVARASNPRARVCVEITTVDAAQDDPPALELTTMGPGLVRMGIGDHSVLWTVRDPQAVRDLAAAMIAAIDQATTVGAFRRRTETVLPRS